MASRSNRQEACKSDGQNSDPFDLECLLRPAQAFEHPMDVFYDDDLTLREKRAILAAWASDACAVAAVPDLRHAPATKRPVCFDDVMDALRMLDRKEEWNDWNVVYPRHLRRPLLLIRGGQLPGCEEERPIH